MAIIISQAAKAAAKKKAAREALEAAASGGTKRQSRAAELQRAADEAIAAEEKAAARRKAAEEALEADRRVALKAAADKKSKNQTKKQAKTEAGAERLTEEAAARQAEKAAAIKSAKNAPKVKPHPGGAPIRMPRTIRGAPAATPAPAPAITPTPAPAHPLGPWGSTSRAPTPKPTPAPAPAAAAAPAPTSGQIPKMSPEDLKRISGPGSANDRAWGDKQLKAMRELGRKLDTAGFDADTLKPEHFKSLGTQAGREVVEVTLPPYGNKQLFYLSSGGGRKKAPGGFTGGMWGPYAGHYKQRDLTKEPIENWFNKAKDYLTTRDGTPFMNLDSAAQRATRPEDVLPYNSRSWGAISKRLKKGDWRAPKKTVDVGPRPTTQAEDMSDTILTAETTQAAEDKKKEIFRAAMGKDIRYPPKTPKTPKTPSRLKTPEGRPGKFPLPMSKPKSKWLKKTAIGGGILAGIYGTSKFFGGGEEPKKAEETDDFKDNSARDAYLKSMGILKTPVNN